MGAATAPRGSGTADTADTADRGSGTADTADTAASANGSVCMGAVPAAGVVDGRMTESCFVTGGCASSVEGGWTDTRVKDGAGARDFCFLTSGWPPSDS